LIDATLLIIKKSPMNKAELIAELAERAGLKKQKAAKVLDAYMEIVTEKMSNNEEVVLIGFGTLVPRPQTSRLARNPKTGEPVMIKPRTTVKFKPGKFLLEAMNGKK
jgi:DNA-binding protein HU-beta